MNEQIDFLILKWCNENGWTEPVKRDGIWWAYQSHRDVMRIPVPVSEALNTSIREAAMATGASLNSVAQAIAGLARQMSPSIQHLSEVAQNFAKASSAAAKEMHQATQNIAELHDQLKEKGLELFNLELETVPVRKSRRVKWLAEIRRIDRSGF